MNAIPVLNLSRGILLASASQVDLTDPWLTFFYCLVDVPPDTSQRQPSLIVLFLVFQAIGLVGGIIIILTARFYSPIKRHATWYNFMVILSSSG